jgi:hypothetical protein
MSTTRYVGRWKDHEESVYVNVTARRSLRQMCRYPSSAAVSKTRPQHLELTCSRKCARFSWSMYVVDFDPVGAVSTGISLKDESLSGPVRKSSLRLATC